MESKSPSWTSRIRLTRAGFWRRARQVVQAATLVFFFLLVVHSIASANPVLPRDTLLRLDPLAAVAAMLSSRAWLARFVPALFVVAGTLLLGRFWCGWLCPLGTIIDWTSPRRKQASRGISPRWRSVKYVLLFLLLFFALWGSLTLMILDPLTIFYRAVSTVVIPALDWLITTAEVVLYRFAFLRDALNLLDSSLRGSLLSYQQPYYAGWLLAALVGGILALNLVERRFWCRYLCPLGGLLSLLARPAWLKRQVSSDCVSCGACSRECRMGTIDPQRDYASDSGECILCMDCGPRCPKSAIHFGGKRGLDRGWGYDPSRRQLLGAAGAGLGALALLNIAPDEHHPHPYRLRPPGATEQELLASCIRCGACMRVCPTHGLQPSVTEAGVQGLWTPILVPRLGNCEYSCTACGETCPTSAIPRLDQATKVTYAIGKAYIDQKVCIPWSGRADCIVCEEMCPLPDKAIKLEEHEVVDTWTRETRMRYFPVVRHDLCIGCGLCEQKCPVNGEAAIRVTVDPLLY